MTAGDRIVHQTVTWATVLGLFFNRFSMQFDRRAILYGFEHAMFQTAGALFRRLGLERASAFSGAVWRRLAPLSKRHGRALGHLALSLPEKTAAEREAIVRAMWENLGRNFAEAFFLREIASSDRVTYEKSMPSRSG